MQFMNIHTLAHCANCFTIVAIYRIFGGKKGGGGVYNFISAIVVRMKLQILGI